jgi:hypothetical protein
MHSVIHNYCPNSFINIWTFNNERIDIPNLRNANAFTIPNPKIELFKKSPLYTLPNLWNNLDINIKLQNQKTTFRIALKEKLITEIDIQ